MRHCARQRNAFLRELCQYGEYQIPIAYFLESRVDSRQLPIIRIVDMRQQNRKRGELPFLSPLLVRTMGGRLARKEQIILFLNCRGYASTVLCKACGHVCLCLNCSVALTYHQHANKILCHICGHYEQTPQTCPACGDPAILDAGVTQKVEEAVNRIFPNARRGSHGC